MKMFRIKRGDDKMDHRRGLRAIPWDMIEPHRFYARMVHKQELERLNDRGGLSLNEILWVLKEAETHMMRYLPESVAYEHLVLEIVDWVVEQSATV